MEPVEHLRRIKELYEQLSSAIDASFRVREHAEELSRAAAELAHSTRPERRSTPRPKHQERAATIHVGADLRSLSSEDRDRRIVELWQQREEQQRTEGNVVIFYYWLSQHQPNLVPTGAGAYQQLRKVLGDLVVGR